MKPLQCLMLSLLAGCATIAKNDPDAITTIGRVTDMVMERPAETYTYTPPSNYGTAANAAANVAMNDTLRRPYCNYTIKTETGETLKVTERNCPLSKGQCVQVWLSKKTPRPSIEAGTQCRPEAGAGAP